MQRWGLFCVESELFELVGEYCPKHWKDPHIYALSGTGFRDAYLAAVKEYNEFGVARNNSKYQIDHGSALELYGLKEA